MIICILKKSYRIKKIKSSFSPSFINENINFAANKYRDVAQLVAYHVRDVGVAGSNPVIPTFYKNRNRRPVIQKSCRLFIIFANKTNVYLITT